MKLDEIEKLCNDATEEPWELMSYGPYWIERPNRKSILVQEESDAKFIATARNLLPKLIAVAKAAKFFEENSYDYPEQSSFWLSDQKAFFKGQSDLKLALEELEKE